MLIKDSGAVPFGVYAIIQVCKGHHYIGKTLMYFGELQHPNSSTSTGLLRAGYDLLGSNPDL